MTHAVFLFLELVFNQTLIFLKNFCSLQLYNVQNVQADKKSGLWLFYILNLFYIRNSDQPTHFK